MTTQQQTGTPVFRVIDAMDGPHAGQLLKLRLVSGGTPALKEIKGGRFRAKSPGGQEVVVRVVAFSLVGGKPSQARFARTGRLDVLAMGEDPTHPISPRWTLTGSN